MTADCPDTTTAWGALCETCGQRLPPKLGPLRSWRSERNIDRRASEASRLTAPASEFMPRGGRRSVA